MRHLRHNYQLSFFVFLDCPDRDTVFLYARSQKLSTFWVIRLLKGEPWDFRRSNRMVLFLSVTKLSSSNLPSAVLENPIMPIQCQMLSAAENVICTVSYSRYYSVRLTVEGGESRYALTFSWTQPFDVVTDICIANLVLWIWWLSVRLDYIFSVWSSLEGFYRMT